MRRKLGGISRVPTGPGELLSEHYLKPLRITQGELAVLLGCEVKKVNRLVNGRIRLQVSMARDLADLFGTSVEFWLKAQRAVDLWKIRKRRRLDRLLVIGRDVSGVIV